MTTESQDKPKGFTQSMWFPVVIMGPFVLMEMYRYWSTTDYHSLITFIIEFQMTFLTFMIPAFIGWAWVNWIEKRDPSFFEEEDTSIPLPDNLPAMNGFYILGSIGLALIFIGIVLIKQPSIEGALIIMGAMILGINLWGLIPTKSLKHLTKYARI